jgi:basic amino acid/polyamine antiporter, APA family
MLRKKITLLGIFSIAAGAMISSGIFILPGMAYEMVGPAVVLSYFLAGVFGLTGILSVVEMATAMPRTGGDFFFINKSLGPLFGTLMGFLSWTALSLKSAFAIYGLTELISIYLGISYHISGLVIVGFFAGLNIFGVKEASNFQIFLVAGLLLILLGFILYGLPYIEFSRFAGFMDEGSGMVFITSAFVFITFGGLIQIANLSEEVKNPRRNLPLGIISAMVITAVFYTAVVIVLTGTLEAGNFAGSTTPVGDSAANIMGASGFTIIAVASALAFISTANAGLMSAARYPVALSQDKLVPKTFGLISKKFRTPVLSVLITAGLIYFSLMLPVGKLVEVASTVVLASYLLTNISVIILRESNLINYRPTYKAPLYPWLQVISIIAFVFFMVFLGAEAIEVSLIIVATAIFLFFIYGRQQRKREFALQHLIERFSDKHLTENILEDELRMAIMRRESIEQDNFDKLLVKAQLIEIPGPLDLEPALTNAFENIHKEVEPDPDELQEHFLKKAIGQDVCAFENFAVIHYIPQKEMPMFLMMIRSANGIKMPFNNQIVNGIFLLSGSRDHHFLHVKTLASALELIQSDRLREQWLKKDNVIELKNMMILNNRKRFL